MVKGAIDAFLKHDDNLAKEIILSDKEANNLRNLIQAKVVKHHLEELINDQSSFG